MRPPRLPGLTLRTKLALVAISLLSLPWVGFLYVKEMERFLLAGQAQTLVALARAVATALHDRPQLLNLAPRDDVEMRRKAEDELRRLASERGETPPDVAEVPAAPILPTPARDTSESARREISAILQGLERAQSRIWVVNRDYRVLALAGNLKAPGSGSDNSAWQRMLRPALAWLMRPPREDFDDSVPDDLLNTSREIGNALRGLPGSRSRVSHDGRVVIVSAAHPIWSGDEVVGAVVVEETTNPILSLSSLALERLLVLTLTVFLLGAIVLLWLAVRISVRVRRLRDEAEGAVDAQGRITRLTAGSTAADEIGDLSRSFSRVLSKLGQYHGYLESLAGRLSHELRTPVAVVRSSLENLSAHTLPPAARVYIERAEAGVQRLSTLLTRMSEATRLEASIRSAERERFDLAQLTLGCVAGYRLAYPQREFSLTATPSVLPVLGSPDLAAQMLDKLVANANDFGEPASLIELDLEKQGHEAVLRVSNSGPKVPDEIRTRLFDSMVSVRPKESASEPHLGLGLFIVRLVVEFHGGTVTVGNGKSGRGASFEIRLPLA